MSDSRNADKFPLRDLLRTVLHAHLLLQCAFCIVIQCLQGDAQFQHTDITGDSMFNNTVAPGLNTFVTINVNESVIDHQNTDAEVPDVTVRDNVQHLDTEARREVTGALLN
jgi:hypothetical protein